MKERLKELRKALGLTQQRFADRIGVKRNTMANYESGRNVPIDAVVSLICREFHVREEWLRTGEGEMFVNTPRNEKLLRWVEEMTSGGSSFPKRFILALSQLDTQEWDVLAHLADNLTQDGDQHTPAAPTEEELAIYERVKEYKERQTPSPNSSHARS